MELNIRIPDHTSAIFDYLQKGQFVCSNSCSESVRDMYDMIDDDYDALSLFFSQIGYTLERGNEYFYFSRTEPRATLEQKILRAYYWIDVLDLFKTYDETFGAGFRFQPEQILVEANINVMLQNKLDGLRTVDTSQYTSWMNDIMDLHGDDIHQVVDRLNHYYGTDIGVRGGFRATPLYGKLVYQKNIDEVLKAINIITGTRMSVSGGRVYEFEIVADGEVELGQVLYTRTVFSDAKGKILSAKYAQFPAKKLRSEKLSMFARAPENAASATVSVFAGNSALPVTVFIKSAKLNESL